MSGLDYRAIRKRIPIRRVLELLRYQVVIRRGAQWRGPCPICSTAARTAQESCFSVHVSRNLFRCFSCQRSGNQLDLWAHVSGLSLYPAALDLCRQLNIEPIKLEDPQLPSRH